VCVCGATDLHEVAMLASGEAQHFAAGASVWVQAFGAAMTHQADEPMADSGGTPPPDLLKVP
jgi:hypothetical protein